MIYSIEYTNRFEKDVKLSIKRGLNILLLKKVICLLETGEQLPPKYKAHVLLGNYNNCWECHIKPDWLLIWSKDDNKKVITLYRTGTHSDLF